MKKPDQCRAVAMCSHLFWVTEGEKPFKDAKRLFECLLKASKVADSCVDSDINVVLFVEILNEYLFYFEDNADAVRGIALTRDPLVLKLDALYRQP